MILDAAPRLGVIPSVSPTVPTAEAVSNRQVSIGSPSVRMITNAPKKNSTRYMSRIVDAFLTTASSIRRPKKWVCSFRQNVEIAVAERTAMVVVFIPPAVEPGLPPISMSKMMIYCPVSFMDVKSIVLNPAVLGVTD